MRSAIWLPLVFSIAACAAPGGDGAPGAQIGDYAAMSTLELWQRQTAPASTRELLATEAELGVRGETSYGGSFIGRGTAGTVGRPLYARPAPTINDRDCADFASAAEAQRYFLDAGGPINDANGLDRDGDGNACEWGVTLRANAARFRPAPMVRSASRYSPSGCFVGPRGGTYTITASGAQDYDGC